MRVLLHGEDQVGSRNRLTLLKEDAKKGGLEVVSFLGKDLELVTLQQAVESRGLLGGDRLVVIEGLFGARSSNRVDGLMDYLSKTDSEELVLWEDRKVDGRKLRKFKDMKTEEFKLSTSIFKFVEAVSPGNTKSMLVGIDQALENSPAELVFFMLCRQVRMLIEVLGGGFKGPGWLVGKLKGQADRFGLEGLLDLHARLYRMEKAQKTGETPLPLATNLELLLASI